MKAMSYPSDLSNAQWELIQDLVPEPKPGGRPPDYERREIVNAILYLVRTGGAWRQMPHDFPPFPIVFYYYRLWTKSGLWEEINTALREKVRRKAGKQSEPTAGVLDSQSVKMSDQGGPSGFDAGKKIKGRKRHLLTDSLGLLMAVMVTPADVQDRDGAVMLLAGCFMEFWSLAVIWADAAYKGALVEWVKGLHPQGNLHLEIVSKLANQKGFVVLPKRWVVERTFGWLYRWRRLRSDYEHRTDHSESMIKIASIGMMLNRLTRT
jgi:putative transposase